MIEILEAPLSVDHCLNAVRQPRSGGIVLFIGTVRNISDGKQIQHLEYESYRPMALKMLDQVVEEVRSRWPIHAIAIQHRVGRLQIGDDAVIVAVSSQHRAEAFAACQCAIDRLKEIVPIWKKEFGDAGEEWVGGPTKGMTTHGHGPD